MQNAKPLTLEAINSDIKELLKSLGQANTKVSSSAYDTAWAARLGPHFPEHGFEQSIQWLRDRQHEDGSWGGEIFHYHDRIVSTISALIALCEAGNDQDDKERIRAGERFLWRSSMRLHYDTNDTIGFPVVIVSLVQQAQQLGLDIPQNLYVNAEKIEKKLNMLGLNPETWRYTTLTHSLEAVLHKLPDDARVDFSDESGCVGAAPASTVATVMDPRTHNERSLTYLENLIKRQGDGGIPTVDEIDIFETAWALNILRSVDWITPDHPQVRKLLDYLWSKWSNETGVGFSSFCNLVDLDDTAVTFTVLRWGGYPASADVFAQYETDTHFRCFPGELDPSLSAQLRMLVALQFAKDHPKYQVWSQKLIQFLRDADQNGYLWFDKWHISPYYLTGPSLWMLHGITDDLLESRLTWLIKSQNCDGGWGYYGTSTLEETIYSLQALLYWNEHVAPIDKNVLAAAISYFLNHVEADELVPLWIGKGLYTPYRVVQASIAVTLYTLHRNSNLLESIMENLMKVDISWDNDEKTIINYKFQSGWTWEDLHAALQKAGEQVAGVNHQVSVIMDFTSASMIPKGALSQIRWAFNNPKPDNIGLTVVVAPNSFFQAMVGLAQKMWGGSSNKWMMSFVTTREESYQMIQEWTENHPMKS